MAEHSQKAKEPTFPSIRCIATIQLISSRSIPRRYTDHTHHSPVTHPHLLCIFFRLISVFFFFHPFFSIFSWSNMKDFAKKVYEDYRVRSTEPSLPCGSFRFCFIISWLRRKAARQLKHTSDLRWEN